MVRKIDDDFINALMDDPVNGGMFLASSFKAFHSVFTWYMYRQQWVYKPFHDLIIKEFEAIAFGKNRYKNLVINIPPRFGKTKLCESFEAWTYFLNPHSNIIHTSYSDDLVVASSKAVREIVTSDLFQKLSGGVKLKKDVIGAGFWKTEAGGAYRAAALGASITGFGCGVSGNEYGGFCLVDDPLKSSDVKSKAEIQNCIDYYLNTLKSRKNNQNKTPFIIIMQRLDVDDLTGYVLENEKDDWKQIKLPALDEEKGVALWEEKFSKADLLKLKEQSPFVYYGQYQQEPIVLGGSVFKAEWWRFYNPNDSFTYLRSYIVADTAMTKKESSDFTVFQYWGLTIDNRLHLLDMVRSKFDAAELEVAIVNFWKKHEKGGLANGCAPYGFYIEDKSSGTGVMQNVRHKYPIPIIPISRTAYRDEQGRWKSQDKYSRALTAIPHIVNGWVYLPNSERDPISAQLISEASAFKADLTAKHDDMVDTCVDSINIAFGSSTVGSVFI